MCARYEALVWCFGCHSFRLYRVHTGENLTTFECPFCRTAGKFFDLQQAAQMIGVSPKGLAQDMRIWHRQRPAWEDEVEACGCEAA